MSVNLRPQTRQCLERLERLIDTDHLRRLAGMHEDCRHYRPIPHLPVGVRFPPPDWPAKDFLEIQHDMEKMLLSELAIVYSACLLKDDRLLSIRANYGTGILPSLFGCEVRCFEKNLPCALPLHDTDKIRKLIDAGVPDMRAGLGGRVLDTVVFYREVLAEYPAMNEHVKIDLADTQGPMDAAEIVWGSEIFLAMYDEPKLVHDFLDMVTRTVRAFSLAHQAIDGISFDGQGNIWGGLGRICIREDASVNISGEMYDQFVKPYTQKLLDEFGGCIHWCGDAKAWWRSLITLRRLTAVNPFQSEFYDPIEMHRACRAAGVSIFNWTRPLPPAVREQITTGLTLFSGAKDFETAKRIYEDLVAGR